jgi:FdrA protein
LAVHTLIKAGEYRDSVALMLIARELGALPGVSAVSVVMGTPANKAVLRDAGLLTSEADVAGPNDLLVAVRAKDEASARAAFDKAQALMAERTVSALAGSRARPRSVRTAIRITPEANVAVISVPGEYAAAPAWDALRAGLHVLLFSDHVPLDDEIALKQYASAQGLLMMGPGAGTAILNGIGLGFANVVPRGPVGVVAAAGTGLQEVTTLLAKNGVGITQALGVGGRDVSAAVGGIMLLEGLKALQADPETRVIVVVSKLPAPSVTDKILAQVKQSDKPTVLALFSNQPSEMENGPYALAQDLSEAAEIAKAFARGESLHAARQRLSEENRAIAAKARALQRKLNRQQCYVRGLYSGGTLCEEALRLWQARLGEAWSNAPLDEQFKLPNSNESKHHTAIDLGEEEFTVGRPHPMIDNTLRLRRLLKEAHDSAVAVIVLDVVLGYGAHPDPASEIAPVIAEAKRFASNKNRDLIVVASVTGTEGDPQGLSEQTSTLRKAGTMVMESNAAAAKLAAAIVG